MDPTPTAIDSHRIQNWYRLGPRLYSGAAPDSKEAFAELARLGVRTVISVDGTKPDVESARREGIRYVHLPFGYDGVPSNRVAELHHAFRSSPGPVFVHCHHGKHRGPTAVAILCESVAGWSPERATQWLHQAGTGLEYPGLYRSVAEFRPLEPKSLRHPPILPETAETSRLVDWMVAIDSIHDGLKAAQKAGWSLESNANGRGARELSMAFVEQWRELRRSPTAQSQPEDFQKWLAESESAASRLHQALTASPLESAEANAALNAIARNCVSCHKGFRN